MERLESVLERYRRACTAQQPLEFEVAIASVTQWFRGVTGVPCTARMALRVGELFDAARDAWDETLDEPRYQGDLEVSTRPLRRTEAAHHAEAVWQNSAAWLDGDWPRGLWNVSWWGMTAVAAVASDEAALAEAWEPLLTAFDAGLWLFCVTSQSELVLAPLPSRILLDDQSRLHNEDGPAFVWLDLLEYHWHGVPVPPSVILQPETITLAQIEAEQKAAVAQVMREQYSRRHPRPPNSSL